MVKIGRNDPFPCGSGKKYKSCCLQIQSDDKRLKQIFDILFQVSQDEMTNFPQVLRGKKVSWLPLLTADYLMLALFSPKEMERAKGLVGKGLNPFPGLISNHAGGTAIRLDKSRQVLIQDCKVENMPSISLGSDCTIVLCGHTQMINTIELGFLAYQVELAYIISFGDEINRANMYDFLADLVAYSVSEWRSKNVQTF